MTRFQDPALYKPPAVMGKFSDTPNDTHLTYIYDLGLQQINNRKWRPEPTKKNGEYPKSLMSRDNTKENYEF